MENSLSKQFQTAVMAYFPCTRISEENGTLKATWEIKPNYQYYVPVEKRRTLNLAVWLEQPTAEVTAAM